MATMNDECNGHSSNGVPAGLTTVGRYRVLSKLGQGSAGIVYLGLDPYIKRHIALKLSSMTSQKARERFFTEAQSAGALNNPNIVSVYDVGLHEEGCYIAMEYIKGSTLEKFCHPDTRLPVQRVVGILLSVCEALDYAHKQKIIHRDIKPSNIMVDEEGHTKIADFGIAQMTEKTSEMGVWGTPSYMSPEQLKEEAIGNESDIFSLGCVLYEMLSGQQAFPGENNFSIMYKIANENPQPVHEIQPDIPESFDHIITKAIQKDPALRYQSCMDLAYELSAALRSMTTASSAGHKISDGLDFIHHIPFFTSFSKSQLKELIDASNIIKVPMGKTIVAQGDISDSLYIVLSGTAGANRKGKTIGNIGVGECFGEMSYLCGRPRTATVKATTDCILMRVSATILDRSPEAVQVIFFRNFATTLARRMAPEENGAVCNRNRNPEGS
jgi:serine/threonine protein kinase